MKIKTISTLILVGALAACGPGKSEKASPDAPSTAAAAPSAAPEHDSAGVIAAVDGQSVTLDHEGASAAGLAAGRTAFQAYGDVLAEAPLAPGARVTFKFRKAGDAYELAELKAR